MRWMLTEPRLAMYFNIYIIVSIILGAFFGAFIFQWETLPLV